MFEIVLYGFALGLLAVSFIVSKEKSRQALKKSWKAFISILPALLGILSVVGLVLAILPPAVISSTLGQSSGFLGLMITSIIGAITLIPAFIAFPMAATLLNQGAGLMQIAVFVSTLTMVGTVTAPLEAKYFGWKVTLLRNGFSYLFSFVIAAVIGVVLL